MLEFEVNGKKGRYQITLPTKIEEINHEFLKDCADTIDIAPDYSLIALLYKQPLAMVLNALKKRDGMTTAVVPMFIQSGKTDSEFINSLKLGDKLVVMGSSLSIAVHVNIGINELNIERFLGIVDGDNKFRADVFKYKEPCIFVDFKLIPNCDLKAVHSSEGYKKEYFVKHIPTTIAIDAPN